MSVGSSRRRRCRGSRNPGTSRNRGGAPHRDRWCRSRSPSRPRRAGRRYAGSRRSRPGRAGNRRPVGAAPGAGVQSALASAAAERALARASAAVGPVWKSELASGQKLELPSALESGWRMASVWRLPTVSGSRSASVAPTASALDFHRARPRRTMATGRRRSAHATLRQSGRSLRPERARRRRRRQHVRESAVSQRD